ncbi:MAG: hypothetical protein GZ089_07915 [Aromatoleum sp.]|nr:hypothetical protein [Aromatoleum sp.]
MAAVVALCVVVAAACGPSSPLATPAATSATPSPTQPAATAKAKAIDRRRLPVRLEIPGAHDPQATPAIAPANINFGEYLHVVDLATGTARLLRDSQPVHKRPDYQRLELSPDHGYLAYVAYDHYVVIIEIATGAERAFPLPPSPPAKYRCTLENKRVAWAPDSTRLAIEVGTDMLMLDAASGATRQMFRADPSYGEVCGLSWSPNGDWIVFDDGKGLARIRPDGSGQLSVLKYGGLSNLAWSPDSTTFVFLAATPADYVHAAPFVSTIDLQPRALPFRGRELAWSNDGDRIVYLHSVHGAEFNWKDYIETVDAGGIDQETLLTYQSRERALVDAPFWSPDDAFIAYPTRQLRPDHEHADIDIINTISGEALPAVDGPGSFRNDKGLGGDCRVLPLGWISTTSLVTLTECSQTE